MNDQEPRTGSIPERLPDIMEGVAGLMQYLQGLPDMLVPSEDELFKIVNECLVLTNANYPRDAVVKKVSDLVITWFKKYGKASTINLVETFLINKRYTVIRRLDNGGTKYSEGNRGDQGQSSDVRANSIVAAGDGTTRQPEHGGHDRQEGLHLVESGSPEGGEAGAGIAQPPAGESRHGRATSGEGVSRALVLLELAEHTKDLRVFQKAYSSIRARVRTVEDEGRLMKLATWSGTTATLGLLELVVHNIERVVAELKEIIQKIDAGTISNLDEE